jgi:hypothetical protein
MDRSVSHSAISLERRPTQALPAGGRRRTSMRGQWQDRLRQVELFEQTDCFKTGAVRASKGFIHNGQA